MNKLTVPFIVFLNTSGRVVISILAIFIAPFVMADLPEIESIPDQRAAIGEYYQYLPKVKNNEKVYWRKTYGPDAVEVHPITGLISWRIDSDAAAESFHLGLKASNSRGSVEDTWILTIGNGERLYIGPSENIKTLKEGMNAIQSGDTLVMRNGLWSQADKDNTIPGNSHKGQTLPAGTSKAYTSLMAEDPGEVVIDGEDQQQLINLWGSEKHPDWPLNNNGSSIETNYLAIKGLVLINSDNEALRVNNSKYIKLIDLGIGPSSRDHGAFANVYIYRSQYVLIEGMYIWGHGRYKLQFKNSSESIVRRSIARIDDYVGGEPIGGFISYCSRNILFQNNILIDSDQSNYWGDHKEIINAFGVPATNCYAYPEFNQYKRSLALNVHMGLMNTDARNNNKPTLWQDIVGWDLKPARHHGGTSGVVPMLSGVGATMTDRMTLGRVNSAGSYFMYSREKDSTIKNSILYQIGWDGNNVKNQGALIRRGSGGQFYFSNNNLVGFLGELTDDTGSGMPLVTNIQSIEPNFKYITMLPRDSVLRTAGSGNTRQGAELMTMLGYSGSFYGDDGFDEETNIPMWPFPNQKLAHQYFSQFTHTGTDRNGANAGISGARGFAVENQDLTNYVWSYLGAPTPVFELSILNGDKQVKLLWGTSAGLYQEQIKSYKVYRIEGNNMTLLATLASDVFEYNVMGLSNGSRSKFAVTSVRSDGSESDYAYAVAGRMHDLPSPQPPVLRVE